MTVEELILSSSPADMKMILTKETSCGFSCSENLFVKCTDNNANSFYTGAGEKHTQ